MHAYDVTAGIYEERYSQEQKVKYQKSLKQIDVTEKTMIDVGCGSGLLFEQVAKCAKVVVGVDISRKLLSKAKEQAKRFTNVFVVSADADHLPFIDNYFDVVTAFTVLQNMPKPIQTVAELKRVLCTGGRIVLTGLKKAFPLDRFMDTIENSGLSVSAFIDEESINCYVAVLGA